jgi:hypothetical protein
VFFFLVQVRVIVWLRAIKHGIPAVGYQAVVDIKVPCSTNALNNFIHVKAKIVLLLMTGMMTSTMTMSWRRML